MRVISRSAIREFVERNPKAEKPLDVWYRIAKQASWANIMDVRKDFPPADAVGTCTVFNIHGNAYRLIVKINYRYQTIFIRGIYTHAEYDREGWKDGCK
jgi:mRNA interferase HigB